MRRCPTCQRGYADATEFCLDDGEALVPLEARNVADLIGAQHPPARVHALLRAAALALGSFDLSRLQGALYPEDLELAGDDLDAPRLVIAVDLEARTRDDAAGLTRRAAVQTPEALRGETGGAHEAAAVYGLGCLGFALAEGAFAFEGASPAAMRVRKLLEAPPRSERAGGLAERLVEAMASDPAARPALARFAEPLPEPAPAPVVARAAAPALASPATAYPPAPQAISSLGAPRASSRVGVTVMALGGAFAALSVLAAGWMTLSMRSSSAPAPAVSQAEPPSPVAPAAPSPPPSVAPAVEVAAAPIPEPTAESAPEPIQTARPRVRSSSQRSRRRSSSSARAAARPAPSAASPASPGAGLGLGRVGAGGGGGDRGRGGIDELLSSPAPARASSSRRLPAPVRSPAPPAPAGIPRPPPAAAPRPAPPARGAIARPVGVAAPSPPVETPVTGAPSAEGAPSRDAARPSEPVVAPRPAARTLPPRARSLLP
ncbi:MAG: hypothetical protein R3A48_26755, partial [Polyangiales bacterium]